MSQLSPCPTCRRHARLTDAACPFCNAPLAVTRGTARQNTVLSRGAKRAALFALGASVTVTACGGEADDGDSTDDNAVPIYGAPVSPTDSVSPKPSNTVNPLPSNPDVDPPNQPVYGAPVTPPEGLDDTDRNNEGSANEGSADEGSADSTDEGENTDDSSAESALDGGAPAVDGGVAAVDGGTGRRDGGGTSDGGAIPTRTEEEIIDPNPGGMPIPIYGAPPSGLLE